MSSNITLFQSDSSSATTGNSFDQDAFQDISLPANNNTGLTDTLSTNPLGSFFANDDSVRFGVKTLYIKDLVLLSDHTKWVNGEPTYQIIWTENYPWVSGYIFGNIQIVGGVNGKYVAIRQTGDGIGITGVFRQCAFMVTGDTSATATAQLAVDGANTTTIDFSNLVNPLNDENGNPLVDSKYNVFVNSVALQTKDIHDYRLTALQTTTLKIVGVVVYAQNSGSNIDVFPGSTYNDKNEITTTVGATLALPTFSGSLGGRSLVYKGQNGNYNLTSLAAPNIASIATGSTGTNLVNVTTGTGASFPIGSGIAAFWGSTGYLGSVTNQSTDTLTVSPTLFFGISGAIYKTWSAGQSLPINSSQLILSSTIDFVNYSGLYGATNFLTNSTGSWRIWGNGFTLSTTDSIWKSLIGINTSLGFVQVEGFFSGADVEFVGQGILHATFGVNGYPAWGINSGQTGSVKKTIFNDAGPGWNTFSFSFGASYSGIGINKINLYRSPNPPGQSFGLLAAFDTLVNYVSNSKTTNATNISLGIHRRHFADQLFMQGAWARSSTFTAAGGINYLGASTNAVLKFQWYGQNYGVIGTNIGQSMTVSLDGGAATGITLNIMNVVASEGWHNIVLTCKSTSGSIQAIDVARTQGEIRSLQNQSAIPQPMAPTIPMPTRQIFLSGSGTYVKPDAAKWLKFRMVGSAGGGAGGGTGGQTDGGNGGDTTFGGSTAKGGTGGSGAGGSSGGAGGSGGAIAADVLGFQIPGGSGGGAQTSIGNIYSHGGHGGGSALGGAGGSSASNGAGTAGATNSGSGGSGGGSANVGGTNSGAGGGAGQYVEGIIPSPAATYPFSIGTAGTAGAAGTSGFNGASGALGILIVEEHYV